VTGLYIPYFNNGLCEQVYIFSVLSEHNHFTSFPARVVASFLSCRDNGHFGLERCQDYSVEGQGGDWLASFPAVLQLPTLCKGITAALGKLASQFPHQEPIMSPGRDVSDASSAGHSLAGKIVQVIGTHLC
jgi:hypothetical protein